MQHVLEDYTPRKRDWRWIFLANLAQTCCVSAACHAARVNRHTAYAHREKFPRFRKKWDEALEIGVELLEVYARHRAFNPNDPASHILTMFLLKAHKPQKYRDNGHQIPPMQAEGDEGLSPEALARLSPEELEALEAIAEKLALSGGDGDS